MTNPLSKEEYLDTMMSGMAEATGEEFPDVDIWPYVSELLEERLVIDYVLEKHLVEKIYRNRNKSFDHVLLPTRDKNVFVVIIVDLIQKKVHGHYNLDLNEEYGLTPKISEE